MCVVACVCAGVMCVHIDGCCQQRCACICASCRVLQCAAVCCSVLQCVAVCLSCSHRPVPTRTPHPQLPTGSVITFVSKHDTKRIKAVRVQPYHPNAAALSGKNTNNSAAVGPVKGSSDHPRLGSAGATFWALCCIMLHSVARCCIVLHSVAQCCTVMHCVALCCTLLHCVALCCTVLHCAALCCTVLCCTVLHCAALWCFVVYVCCAVL